MILSTYSFPTAAKLRWWSTGTTSSRTVTIRPQSSARTRNTPGATQSTAGTSTYTPARITLTTSSFLLSIRQLRPPGHGLLRRLLRLLELPITSPYPPGLHLLRLLIAHSFTRWSCRRCRRHRPDTRTPRVMICSTASARHVDTVVSSTGALILKYPRHVYPRRLPVRAAVEILFDSEGRGLL
ncbi:hypothetical protein BZA05DRAFT_155698 [Tricharina praecox]|uniref:uncharacterized protein n=1 Tax=Tricharina praecox TaxID=43433 RepID=UPI00221F37AD|nr:uncharacterized protein BZA05DRAFT_155698 [Tricharina praecox]KAI5844693.1 hypothetical protein BZA05DRAFT_155698 [Tricharina praecox]